MALPSFSELLEGYSKNKGMAGALQSGMSGFAQGKEMAQSLQDRQMQRTKWGAEVQKYLAEAKHAENDKFSAVPGYDVPGKIPVLNNLTGEVELQTAPGARSNKGMLGNFPQVRAAQAILHATTDSANFTRNKQIIERGMRIENLSDPTRIVQSPDNLNLMREQLEAQARGGVSSALGMKKMENETPEQFAARLLGKIVNAPQDAGVKSFVDNIVQQSKQETKSAIQAFYGSLRQNTLAAKHRFGPSAPEITNGLETQIDEEAKSYLSSTMGKEYGESDFSPKSLDRFLAIGSVRDGNISPYQDPKLSDPTAGRATPLPQTWDELNNLADQNSKPR